MNIKYILFSEKNPFVIFQKVLHWTMHHSIIKYYVSSREIVMADDFSQQIFLQLLYDLVDTIYFGRKKMRFGSLT